MKNLILILFFATLLLSCSNKKEEKSNAVLQNGKFEVVDAWLRPAAEGMNSAFFFTIKNGTDKTDTLYEAESDIAEIVQIHETYTVDGSMGMRHKEFVIIPAGETVVFKPRSLHVMAINLKKDISIGSIQKGSLFFMKNGRFDFEAEVKD